MLRAKEQRKTCAKYSAHDANGNVHCNECPLVVDLDGFMCRAWTHYDRHKREWVPDEERTIKEEKE